MIKKDEITLKPLTDKDIWLFESWLDKEYIKKWFGDKEDWLNEINERNGTYSFLKHFIVYHNDRKIGYCLYGDCFYIKELEEKGHDFKSLYGDVAEENHTYEIGFLIGEQKYLNKGIGKIIIQILEAKIVEIGGKEIASDPDEENIISIKTLLGNGFHKKNDGDYRKVIVSPKPLKLLPSVIIFVSAAVLLWVMTHLCIPFLAEVTGWELILFWFICGGVGVFTPLIIVGIIMLRKEGCKFTKETFVERLRFRPMTRRDWKYSLVALVVIGLLTGGIMVAMQTLVPGFNHTPSFMTLESLSCGRYWILLAWLPYWLLNIGGEEFFWRGVLLPRQEVAFGNKAWILHGTGWAIFHIAFGWQLLVMLLPLLYIESYVVQKTQNTWTGVFLHGVINGPSFIAIALGII